MEDMRWSLEFARVKEAPWVNPSVLDCLVLMKYTSGTQEN